MYYIAYSRLLIKTLMILFRGLVWDATYGTTFGNNTPVVGKIWVAGKDHWKSGPRKGALLEGSTDQVVLGVATLE